MAEIKTTTTVEYSVEEMKQLIASKFFPGKQVDINFVIQEVGGDPLDRFPGHNEVTSVRISFDGVIDAKKNIENLKDECYNLYKNKEWSKLFDLIDERIQQEANKGLLSNKRKESLKESVEIFRADYESILKQSSQDAVGGAEEERRQLATLWRRVGMLFSIQRIFAIEKKNIAKAKKTTTVERTEPDYDDVKSVEYAPDYDDVKSDIDDAWEKIRRKFQ